MDEKTTTLQKLGGLLLGAVALLGGLILINWGWQHFTGRKGVFGSSAQEVDSVTAEQAAKGAGLPAPAVAAGLPVVGCGCPQNTNERGDLFPGSYVAFAYTNAGCEVDPRNKRC